jgi:hypothetical protein
MAILREKSALKTCPFFLPEAWAIGEHALYDGVTIRVTIREGWLLEIDLES